MKSKGIRLAVIFVLSMAALIALCGEAEDFRTIVISRVTGLLLCGVIYMLVRYWRKRGYIDIGEE